MVGETIDGRYHVLRLIGAGGMGAVYEARHLGTGRRVAIKVIHAQVAESSEAVQRFHREARAAGSIETPHIVQVLDTGRDPETGIVYMAMEYLQGEDLQQQLKRHGKLPPELALRIVAQACAGLEKAHRAGVVHRDIKPANLFLSSVDGNEILVKVVDFGIAKTLDSGSEDASLTRTGGLVGSPLYVSPEQAMGRKTLDQRTDLWSLGVVLYEALCGRVPRPKSDTVVALMMGICTEPAPPIQGFAPWVHPDVALVVHRMLTIDPTVRFQTAEALLAELTPLLPRGPRIRITDLRGLTPEEEAHVAAPAVLDEVTIRVSSKPRAGFPRPQLPPEPVVVAEIPLPPDESALSVSQSAPGVRVQGRRSLRLPLVALAVAVGAGGLVAARFLDHDDAVAAAPPSPPSPASIDGGGAEPEARPTAAAPEERTGRLVIDPPDARVTVDGADTPVVAGGVELRGPLGSVHHVRLVKGSQDVDGNVAITSLGAVPSRLQIEPAAPSRTTGPLRPAGRAAAPSATAKAAGKPGIPTPDRNFE